MADVKIPYADLNPEFQRLVDAYVEKKLAKLLRSDPDAKIRVADFKRQTREEICTRDRLLQLDNEVKEAALKSRKKPSGRDYKALEGLISPETMLLLKRTSEPRGALKSDKPSLTNGKNGDKGR